MQSYFLPSALSRGSKRTVTFSKKKSGVSVSKSKSGVKKPASKQKLSQKPSATSRRRPVRSSPIWSRLSISPLASKSLAGVMTLLLLTGAVAMIIMYFEKQRRVKVENTSAMEIIREVMILHNESFQGKSDSEILGGVQRLAQYLFQLNSRNEDLNKATNAIIAKLIAGWKPFSGNLYYFSKSKLSFDLAGGTCVRQGGYLVYIHSRAEQEFLAKEVDKATEAFFIGLRKEGADWKWINKDPLVQSFWAPNLGGVAGGDCAVIFSCSISVDCWHKVRCVELKRYICKMKPDPKYLR
ncbi:C-type lectin domain family 10 member A-like [Paroedura picta]|uniref:C-type lectin domain family 10 member A-like n=1 Tax=Paroedura picta TaxID=143630 RepID=UPI004055C45D